MNIDTTLENVKELLLLIIATFVGCGIKTKSHFQLKVLLDTTGEVTQRPGSVSNTLLKTKRKRSGERLGTVV